MSEHEAPARQPLPSNAGDARGAADHASPTARMINAGAHVAQLSARGAMLNAGPSVAGLRAAPMPNVVVAQLGPKKDPSKDGDKKKKASKQDKEKARTAGAKKAKERKVQDLVKTAKRYSTVDMSDKQLRKTVEGMNLNKERKGHASGKPGDGMNAATTKFIKNLNKQKQETDVAPRGSGEPSSYRGGKTKQPSSRQLPSVYPGSKQSAPSRAEQKEEVEGGYDFEEQDESEEEEESQDEEQQREDFSYNGPDEREDEHEPDDREPGMGGGQPIEVEG